MDVPVRPDLVPDRSSLKQVPENSRSENSEKQIKKVVTGKVTEKKPSVAKKFVDTFIAEDLDNIKDFVVYDVIVPAIKDTFLSSLSMLFWGSPNYRNRGGYSNGRTERVSYWSYGNDSRNERSNRGGRPNRRGPSDVRDLIFETRIDAEEVVGILEDTLDRYGKASVADLYDAAGITPEYTDHKWGWVRGDEFHVRPVSGGYVIDLPRYKILD